MNPLSKLAIYVGVLVPFAIIYWWRSRPSKVIDTYNVRYWRNAYEELVKQTGRDLNDGYGVDPRVTVTPPHDWRAKISRDLSNIDSLLGRTAKWKIIEQKIAYARSLTNPEERAYALKWLDDQ